MNTVCHFALYTISESSKFDFFDMPGKKRFVTKCEKMY